MFDATRARIETEITLSAGARYLGWEVTAFGRVAWGERFAAGALRQATAIRIDGRRVWNERAMLEAGDRLFASRLGFDGRSVTGTLLGGQQTAGGVRRAVSRPFGGAVPPTVRRNLGGTAAADARSRRARAADLADVEEGEAWSSRPGSATSFSSSPRRSSPSDARRAGRPHCRRAHERGDHDPQARRGDGRRARDDPRDPGRSDIPDGTKLLTVHNPIV